MKKNDLRVTLVQADLSWEDPAANRLDLARLIESVGPGNTDVIVLPEMFTTGFSMEPARVAESYTASMDSLHWMRYWAMEMDAVVTGSIAVEENGVHYNRLFWVRPDGSHSYYDKRHLFRMAGEDEHYSMGTGRIVEEWRGWRLCPLVCYDLRFPVWSRNRLINGVPEYDVLIYVANWPEPRRDPWMKLAQARAIENQCYVVAVNRVGLDGNANEYSGDSGVIDARGNYLTFLNSGEQVVTQALPASDLEEFRLKFPVLKDADSFSLT